jgi:hypothetical protein
MNKKYFLNMLDLSYSKIYRLVLPTHPLMPMYDALLISTLTELIDFKNEQKFCLC